MNRRLVVLAVAVAVVLTACGDDDSSGESRDRADTKVVVMTHDSFLVSDDVLAAFTKRTGIDVKVLKSGDAGAALNQAILTKDDPLGDVFFGVDNTFLTRALDEDVFVPYEAEGLSAVPDEFVLDAEHRVTPIDYGDVCLNYDLGYFDTVGHPSAPDDLADLADPQYEDLTVVENPATSSPGLAFLLATIAEYGDDWQRYWEQLRDNGVLVTSGWEEAYFTEFTVGGGGQRPIVVSYASSPPADVVFADPAKDTPAIGVVEASCFRQVEFAGVLANAAHPDAAREFVDFMLTSEFQEDVPLSMYVFPVDPQAALPEVFERWAARPAHPYTIDAVDVGEHRNEWIDEWTDIVLR